MPRVKKYLAISFDQDSSGLLEERGREMFALLKEAIKEAEKVMTENNQIVLTEIYRLPQYKITKTLNRLKICIDNHPTGSIYSPKDF